jgi:hypothetical protein
MIDPLALDGRDEEIAARSFHGLRLPDAITEWVFLIEVEACFSSVKTYPNGV